MAMSICVPGRVYPEVGKRIRWSLQRIYGLDIKRERFLASCHIYMEYM